MISGMRKIIIPALIIFLTASATGCATIMNGTSQKIPVSSEPAGATVRVDDGKVFTTPVRLRLERRRDHTLVFTKEGYGTETVRMMHVLSEAVVGNALLGGPLGWVFDIFAGTQYKLIPNPVRIQLKKEEGG